MRRRDPALAALFALIAALPAAADDRAYLARMAQEHRHDAPAASPASEPAPRQEVTTEEVAYATLDGNRVQGYLARPRATTGELPGVLVIQEWWGLNDNIRAQARRLAGEGYVALAVDLYEGERAATAAEAEAAMKRALARSARLLENLTQAHRYLRENAHATGVGVVGWCFGGAWSLETALALGGEIDAAVVYYGRPVTDPARLAGLEAPLLGLYGGADEGIPLADVRLMESELGRLGKRVEIVVYEGAGHAFANPSGTRYQAEPAADAWRRTTEFFARHLGAPRAPAAQR